LAKELKYIYGVGGWAEILENDWRPALANGPATAPAHTSIYLVPV